MKRTQTKRYKTCPKYNDSPNRIQFNKAITLLETILDQHCRILVCRINLSAKTLSDHSDIAALIRRMKQDFGSDFYGFTWSCETSESKGRHYHAIIYLNGSKYKDHITNMKKYLVLWKMRTTEDAHSSIYQREKGPTNSVGLLERGDMGKFDQVTEGLSYLCKKCQKLNSTNRDFNLSQISRLTTSDKKAA